MLSLLPFATGQQQTGMRKYSCVFLFRIDFRRRIAILKTFRARIRHPRRPPNTATQEKRNPYHGGLAEDCGGEATETAATRVATPLCRNIPQVFLVCVACCSACWAAGSAGKPCEGKHSRRGFPNRGFPSTDFPPPATTSPKKCPQRRRQHPKDECIDPWAAQPPRHRHGLWASAGRCPGVGVFIFWCSVGFGTGRPDSPRDGTKPQRQPQRQAS